MEKRMICGPLGQSAHGSTNWHKDPIRMIWTLGPTGTRVHMSTGYCNDSIIKSAQRYTSYRNAFISYYSNLSYKF